MNQLANHVSVGSDLGVDRSLAQNQIRLGDVIAAVRRRIWLLLSVIAIVVVAAGLVIFSLPDKYTAVATLMIDTRTQRVVDIDEVVSGLSSDNATIDTQIRLLTSEELLQTVAQDLDLMQEPELNPLLNEGEGWLATVGGWLGLSDAWMEASSGGIPGQAHDPEEIAARNLNAVTESLRERLNVRQLGLSTVIEVGVTSLSPQLATTIANAIADTYIRDQVEAKLEATEQASDWLQSRLGQLRVDVLEAERAVEEFRAQTVLVDRFSQELQQEQIHRLGMEELSAEIELGNARALLATVEGVEGSDGFFDVLSTMEPAVAATVIAQWRVLTEARGRAGFDPESTDPFIEEFTAAMHAYLRNRVSVAEQTLDLVNARLMNLQDRATVLDLEMVNLRALEREAEARRTVLELFLTRLRETEQIDFEQPDARIISRATRPTEPSQPNRKLLFVVAGMVGLMLGFALVFTVEAMNRRVRTSRELEDITKVGNLGNLPWIKKADVHSLVESLSTHPNTSISNALRSITLNLMKHKTGPDRAVTVLITSSLANEGKTTLAALLASVASGMGLRSILIDGDARKGTLSRELLRTSVEGAAPTGNGKSSDNLGKSIPGMAGGAFNFIPAEPFVNDQNGGIAPTAIHRIVELLRPRNDLIIIDAAPVLLVAETKSLLASVDGVLFLARANSTKRDDVERSLRELRMFDARVFGTVLTMDRDRATARSYKYYYSYKPGR